MFIMKAVRVVTQTTQMTLELFNKTLCLQSSHLEEIPSLAGERNRTAETDKMTVLILSRLGLFKLFELTQITVKSNQIYLI